MSRNYIYGKNEILLTKEQKDKMFIKLGKMLEDNNITDNFTYSYNAVYIDTMKIDFKEKSFIISDFVILGFSLLIKVDEIGLFGIKNFLELLKDCKGE